MINVKSISQYDNWSKNWNPELSLTSDTQLELSDNSGNLVNSDNNQGNINIDYLNANAINQLVTGNALIEVSLETLPNGSRKSYKFPFGEFVKLVAQNLAYLNKNSGGGFLTEDRANDLYVQINTKGEPQTLYTSFSFSGDYVDDDTEIISIASGKCTFQDIETQGIKANDTIDASGKHIQANSVSTTTLTANSTITCGTGTSTTTINGDDIACDDITCDKLTSNSSLTVGSTVNSLNANTSGVNVTNLTASTSITTPKVNGDGSTGNTTLSLDATDITIPQGSSLTLNNGHMKIKGTGQIEVGEGNSAGTISNANGRVKISKLRVGDGDNYDGKSNLEVDSIEIGDTVTAQRFQIKNNIENIYMNETGFHQKNGQTAELTAQAACWS